MLKLNIDIKIADSKRLLDMASHIHVIIMIIINIMSNIKLTLKCTCDGMLTIEFSIIILSYIILLINLYRNIFDLANLHLTNHIFKIFDFIID